MRFSREITTLFLLVVSVVALGQATDITFTVKGLEASEAYLGYHLADQKFVEDTLQVAPGGVMKIFDEEGLRPGLYFIYVQGGVFIEFIINEPKFNIVMEGEGYEGFLVEGSQENEAFKRFQLRLGRLQAQRVALMDSLQQLTGSDSLKVRQQIAELGTEANTVRDDIIEANPELMISKMLRLMQPVPIRDFPEITDQEENRREVVRAYKETFRERLDFEETGLLRTPIFKDQVMRYLTNVISQAPDSIITELDEILTTVKDDELAYRFWLVTVTGAYQEPKFIGHDAVLVHLYENYYLASRMDWMSEESLEQMKEEVAFLKPNLIGQPAPSLNLLDTTQAPVDALALDSEYLVLYFYDPDCGHCREKTPVLLDAYYDIKDLGAEVVAVCTVTDQEKWKSYINDNGLDWVNLADPHFQSNFRAEYNVRTTPQVFILDSDRKIVAKKLDVDQVINFITDHRQIMNP